MPTLTPIYAPTRRPGRVHLGAVSADTMQDIDDAWEFVQENPGHSIKIEFDTVKEARRWFKEARSYCETLDPPVKIRQERSEKYAEASELVRFFVLKLAPDAESE